MTGEGRRPPDGWQAEDLDRLPPEAPRHIELIDGALVVPAQRKSFHATVVGELYVALRPQVPKGWAVTHEMTIRLNDRQRPEPDVLVLDRSALADGDRTWYSPEEVHLVVEVVSPESRTRDTFRKPQLYAAAGIKHFWRVDNENGRAVVHTFELEPPAGSYVPTGIYRETMKLAAPFPMTIQVDTLHAWLGSDAG